MSEEVTLDEFVEVDESNEQTQRWKKVQLHEVAYKRSDNVNPQEIDLEKHIGLEHINPNSTVPDWEPLDDLSSTKRRFKPGDILFAKLRPNLEKSAQPEFEGVASTDIFPIVAEDNINSKWLLYRLSSKPAYDYARRTSAGTRMPRTSWNLFSNFEFDLPPLPEQRKIATVLYTVGQVIEKTEKLIEGLQTARKGLGQELLISGFEQDDDLVSTRAGPISFDIPSDWNVVTIDDITDTIYRYPTYQNIDYVDEGVPEVRVGMLKWDGSIERGGEKYISESTSEEYPRTQLEHGDTVMAVRGATLGKVASVPEWLDGGNINPNVIRISSNAKVLNKYLTELFLSSLVQRQVKAFSQQTTVKTIKSSDIRRITVPIPPIAEQEKIIEILSNISSRIENEESYLSCIQRFKQGLMQDLLSGKVRTTDTNIQVPDKITQYG